MKIRKKKLIAFVMALILCLGSAQTAVLAGSQATAGTVAQSQSAAEATDASAAESGNASVSGAVNASAAESGNASAVQFVAESPAETNAGSAVTQTGLETVKLIDITGTEEGDRLAAELAGADEADVSDSDAAEGAEAVVGASEEEAVDETGATESLTVPQYDTAVCGDEDWEAAVEAISDAIADFELNVELTQYAISVDDLSNLYTEVRLKSYVSFFVDATIQYSHTSDGTVQLIQFIYVLEEDEGMEKKAELESIIEKIVSGADERWSDLEKAVYLNMYLAKNCEYDLTYSNYTAYDALVTGSAVCQGYANAFYVLAGELGLDSEVVTCDTLNHAWNVVNINGSYYHVDVTWDDPVTDVEGRALFTYFLKSSEYFQSSSGKHAANDWVVTGGLSESDMSDTSYDSEAWSIFSGVGGAVYMDGLWYAMEETDVNTYTCDGVTFTKNATVFSFYDAWYERYYSSYSDYIYIYMLGTNAVDTYSEKLYYAVLDQIICYDPEAGTHTVVYELTEEQLELGYIQDVWILDDSTVMIKICDYNNDYDYVEAFRILDAVTIERVSVDAGSISAELLLAIIGDRDCEQLVFSHVLTLTSAETVVLTLEDDITGDKAVLLQPDSAGDLSYVTSSLIANGAVSLTFEQYADSAVVYGYNGDVTGDEDVNASDTLAILRGVSGRTTLNAVQEGFADVNLDGAVNSNDLLAVVKYVSGRTSTLN